MSDHEAVPEVPEPDVQTALSSVDDDLVPTNTTGYKPAAQKTVNELLELDQNDESLKKWKETLLKNVTKGIALVAVAKMSTEHYFPSHLHVLINLA